MRTFCSINLNKDYPKFLFEKIKSDPFYEIYNETSNKKVGEISIIMNMSCSKEEKQIRLEALNTPFSSQIKKLRHEFNPLFIDAIDCINSKTYAIGDTKIKDFYKNLCGEETVRFHALTLEKQKAVRFLFELSKKSLLNDADLGLAIVHYFGKVMKQIAEKEKYIFSGDSDSYMFGDMNEPQKIGAYELDIQKQFEDFSFTANKTSVIIDIAKEILKYGIMLDYSIKKKLEEEGMETMKPFERFNINETVELAIFISSLLESTKLIKVQHNWKEPSRTFKSTLYILPKEIIKILFSIQIYDETLPMICPPNDWVFGLEGDGYPKEGGYLINKSGVFPAVHTKSEYTITKVDEKSVKCVNYLQKQKYSINKSELALINLNEGKYLKEYLNMSVKEWEEMFIYNEKDNSYAMMSLYEYVEIKLKKFNKKKETNSWIYINNKEYTHLCKIRHQTVIACVLKFKYIIQIAKLLENETLYFAVFFDARGRVYYTGYGLSPQGDALSKLLLNLDVGESTCELTFDEKIIKHDLEKKSTIKGKKYFEYRKLVQAKRTTIGLDVSNSGSQIASGVIGSLKGLVDTNFIVLEKDIGSERKKDVYLNVLNRMLENCKKELPQKEFKKMKHENIINKKTGKPYYTEEEFENKKKSMYDSLQHIATLFDRSYIKGWTMRFVYSEGDHARSQHFADYISENSDMLYEAYGVPYFNRGDYYIMARAFSLCFISSMKEEYTDLWVFSEKMQYVFQCLAKEKKTPFLTIKTQDKGNSTNMFICNQKSKKIYFVNRKTYQKTCLQIKIDTNEPDIKKIGRGVVPHFMHNLDSEIMKEIVTLFMEQNRPIGVIHDCFLISLDDIEFLKTGYFNAFKKCILESRPLETIFCNNVFDIEADGKKVKNILEYCDLRYPCEINALSIPFPVTNIEKINIGFEKMTDKKVKLLNDINKNKYIISKRILS